MPGSLTPLITAVSARGENRPNETAARAADNDRATKWYDGVPATWLQYELSSAQVVTSYQLTSANDAPGRDPRDFTLQGSNDGGATWTTLDTRSAQVWQDGAAANRGVTKTFEVTGAAAFTAFRLDITANNGEAATQLADLQLLGDPATTFPAPIVTELGNGPTFSQTARTGVGFTGARALRYAGLHLADGPAKATNALLDVEILVEPGHQLTYDIFPVLGGDLSYPSMYAAVDLVFDDGSRLSSSGAADRNGYGASALEQGRSDALFPDQWNSIRVDLTPFVGRTIEKIAFAYDNPDGKGTTSFSGWLDDITVEPIDVVDDTDGLVSFVDTRRGSHSSGDYSRGLTFPATAWPNGFNFFTPMTNGTSISELYEYHRKNGPGNLPELEGIGISHQPSIWMQDRNQLAVLPALGTNPTSALDDRELSFRHENETARPDIYSVEFENGITTEVTPTDHGGVYRFTFPGETGSVLVDQVAGSSGLNVAADGTVSGWVEGGSGYPGRTRMFVAGQFDATPTQARATSVDNRNGSARFAAFDTSDDDTVELRIATSFISADQAHKNLDLEVTGRSFEDVQAAATAAWNERLEVLEIEGATQDQRVTTYSNLYRLNLYPNSQFENTGTAEAPVYRYASPVSPTVGSATATQTNAPVKDGKVYVNNGFWDTYRTTWPLYSTLYPELADELIDGFTQQYRDGGWIARWSAPGYADLMTGTSSDVAFADAYLAGALGSGGDIDAVLETYDAAIRNATVLPATNAVGRKGLETSIFQGWTQQGTHESASWGLEGYINDFGIAQMAAALAQDPRVPAERVATLQEEAAYFDARSKNYATMFNTEANTFTARYRDGRFAGDANFDKLRWQGDFTEATAWTFGFHVPFDVDGLAALYGSRENLVGVLDEFIATPETAQRSNIHEAREARDVRLGLLGMSNQVPHHIPYIYAAAGKPSATQELVRDINKRLFVGADIGQGYLGDEDNGEMSSWQLFSALGFYPLQVGSGDFTIGSPMFDRATLKLPGGDLVVSAPGASQGQVYVDGVTFDGEPIEDVVLDGDLVRGGGELTFTMSETPSDWGSKDMGEDLEVPAIPIDATKPGNGSLAAADGTDISALVDDDARTSVTFPGDEAVLTWTNGAPVIIDRYTLTNGGSGDPAAWVLEGSTDGQTWTELDARTGEEFRWDTQTRPFSLADPTALTRYRLTIRSASGPLVLSEVELFGTSGVADTVTLTPALPITIAPGQQVAAPVANLVGPSSDAADYAVEVDYRDGTGPHTATLTRGELGGFTVTAPHVLARAGVYDAVVTASNGGVSTTLDVRVVVERDETLTGARSTVCIGDLGRTAGSCDGGGYTFDRATLASSGFVQGETVSVGRTGLSFDLPLLEPGSPDAVTNAGQVVDLQLGEGATRLSFVGTATGGDKNLRATLTFTDGSTQEVPLQFGDWVSRASSPAFGNIVVGTSQGRLRGLERAPGNANASVFATTPVTLATDGAGAPKVLRSLTLPPGGARPDRCTSWLWPTTGTAR
ncbi:GH92 family glycosyl hydrolase [Litorihabitans aurantiacus]|uniref:Alpha-1 2-mannosidase n=1 Tax=Litorihabitans aurantiacus TaxID=1930061 RepID=A0AA38CRD9_9MICO|nr:GH92 family glycosyl hydrolase [Litorihabitans aurantiacus]GMA31809.1 alpha-1 2-mannosidase [Litorihabitans aurantiacus]GMA31811.1 alpha-1 2-mannosidase [Litorihabitans aurantiacus]